MQIEVADLKIHLYKLLLEQYHQEALFDELYYKGIDMYEIAVDNLEIILDIIGFPVDNSVEYDIANDPEIANETYKPEDYKERIDRYWLREKYQETIRSIEEDEQLFVSEDKVEAVTGATEENIYVYLTEYIEWLYEEYKHLNDGKNEL